MTGLRFDSPSVWEGPHWAAPEFVKRYAVKITYRRNTSDPVPLIAQLMCGMITAAKYDEMRKR